MAHEHAKEPVDERLESLLANEQRLEARVRDAERAARERVAAARKAAEENERERLSQVDSAARREEESERERTRREIERIEREAADEIARLAAQDDATVERLARRLYARIAGAP